MPKNNQSALNYQKIEQDLINIRLKKSKVFADLGIQKMHNKKKNNPKNKKENVNIYCYKTSKVI